MTKARSNATAPAAKGEIVAGTGSELSGILSVGANGQVLTANSATTTGLQWANPAGGGKILQVVMGTTSSAATSSTATWVNTNLSASITPSATTSRVLVLVSQNGCNKSTAVSTSLGLKLQRNSTDLIQFAIYALYTNSSDYNDGHSMSASFLDSPATTSSITYRTQFSMDGSGGNVTVNANGAVSTMILLEVGA